MTARFVVGTGRCGSTLLSRMLACNPSVLSLSEFYAGLDWNKRLQPEPMTGQDFQSLITAAQPLLTMVLERGYRPSEVLYPFESEGARYTPQMPVPYLAAITLPHLCSEPDKLLDEICSLVVKQSSLPPARHAEILFDWLCQRFQRELWVERSAASISWLGDLAAAFPGARFLHLHRQGEEVALSLREHPVFRLAVMLSYDLPIGEGAELERFQHLSRDRDRIAGLLSSYPAPEYFARFWTQQLTRGFRDLAHLDASQYRELRFEDLLQDPADTLIEICDFLQLPDSKGSWRFQAASLVEELTPPRFPNLSPEEKERLIAACAAGNELLGRA